MEQKREKITTVASDVLSFTEAVAAGWVIMEIFDGVMTVFVPKFGKFGKILKFIGTTSIAVVIENKILNERKTFWEDVLDAGFDLVDTIKEKRKKKPTLKEI